jgi:dihydroorotase
VVADLVVFDVGDAWTITADTLLSRGKNTPLLARALPGRVLATVADGRLAYRDPAP